MAGTERRWNPAACSPGKTAAASSPSISPKCGSRCSADGATVIREGHGTGEGRGTSPGEVHDIALKAAETDATKRAFATFGKPFGLELYRKDKISSLSNPTAAPPVAASAPTQTACRLSSRRYDANPAAIALLWPAASELDDCASSQRSANSNPGWHLPRAAAWRPQRPVPSPRQNRQEPTHHRRTQTSARQGPSEICRFTAVPGLRASTRPILITCALLNRGRLGLKSAMNSPCRFAAAIIDSSIRPAMRWPGGQTKKSMHWRSLERFGSKHTPVKVQGQ